MCSSSDAGGAVPCPRQTTIGTAQISHSAIQQMSSSWNHSVMRAASHRSQWSLNSYPRSLMRSRVSSRLRVQGLAELADELLSVLGAAAPQDPADQRAP